MSTRYGRPPLRYGPAGDTPPVPPLRQQLWALRPGLDGASRPFTTFAPNGQLASGRWLALRARSHSAQAVANAGGFRVSLGCTTTSNEEESPLRPTTILRRLLGVTQLNVENGHVAADGPLAVWVRPSWRRSRCGACGRRAPRYDRRPRRRWLHVPWGRTPVWLLSTVIQNSPLPVIENSPTPG